MDEQERFRRVTPEQKPKKHDAGDGAAVVITLLLLLGLVASSNNANKGAPQDTLSPTLDGTAVHDTLPVEQNTITFDSLPIVKMFNSKQK